MSEYLSVSDEVAGALAAGGPVVAFESTIISHGMPYPANVRTALEAEEVARQLGAVPATIAVLDGRIKVGLTEAEVERLAREKGILKVSRRDLAFALTRGLPGATTVSATMLAARMAGISVFATGGIGGVHRGVGESLDISADLLELSQSSVLVVSAGAKAILDLPKTLEVLETLGVPVVGFQTSEFPAFYSRASGIPLRLRVESAEEAAGLFSGQRRLGFAQGVLLANPVPAEWEIPAAQVNQYIARAVDELEERGIRGQEVTPFLLSRIGELSGGRSLETNIKLFHNNVRLACEVAAALCRAG
jgi:pseudouridine-5'-phosphate glycosidase